MKERKLILLILVILIVSIIFYIFVIQNQLLFSPPSTPNFPSGCSPDNNILILILWNSVFFEDITGVTTQTYNNNSKITTGCENYYAYEITPEETFVIGGWTTQKTPQETGVSGFYAFQGNFTNETNEIIRNVNQEDLNQGSQMLILLGIAVNANTTTNPRINVGSVQEALSIFNSTFKPENASSFSGNESAGYSFIFNQTSSTNETLITGTIGSQYSFNTYTLSYVLSSIPANITNCAIWSPLNTTCTASDTLTTYYNNTNSSCISSGTPPANITSDCDYNNFGLIGDDNSLNDINLELDVFINDNEINTTKNYTREELETIEIREGSTARVSFEHDFENVPLNLRNIKIEKQSSSSNYGYLIVDGIKKEKTVRVDKKNSTSTKICVEDKEGISISDISTACSGSQEYKISCPGNGGAFDCDVAGNFFVVSGLNNSGVKEFLSSTSGGSNTSCTSAWNCEIFSAACTNNLQTRICTDSNNCNDNSTRPIESQACSTSCQPNWNCTEYQEECPKSGVKTRTCTDSNNCNNNSTKPAEQKTCVKSGKSSSLITIIFAIVVAIISLGVVVFLIIYLRKLKNKTSQDKLLK